MAVQTVPYALQNASHSAALFRQSASAAFLRGGALSQIELAVTQQGSPNMSVILGAGRAKVTGTSVSPPAGQSFTTQAMYDTLNDAPLTLTIAASNPTNPRIDLVYIQVQDSFYSGSNNQAIAGVVTGTPAASPSVPATPANAVAIATVAVGAGVTSIVNANIARVISTATLLGAPVVTLLADLDSIYSASSQGDQAYMTNIYTGITRTWWIKSTNAWYNAGTIYASSKSNMDSFISSVAGTTSVRFTIGSQWVDTATRLQYAFTSTAGAYVVVAGQRILPTSATNGTVQADGSVTFSAVTTVRVNGIFTSAFRAYDVIIELDSASAADDLRMQLVSGASAYSTGDQGSFGSAWTTGGTPTGSGQSTRTGLLIGLVGTGASFVTTRLMSPAVASSKEYTSASIDTATPRSQFIAGFSPDTASRDGFILGRNAGSGTITGRLYIVGVS